MKKIKKTLSAKFGKFRKLKDGSYAAAIDLDKGLKDELYKMAVKNDELTLSELLYQEKRRSNKTLKDCIVAAQFLRTLMKYVETIQGSSNEEVTK